MSRERLREIRMATTMTGLFQMSMTEVEKGLFVVVAVKRVYVALSFRLATTKCGWYKFEGVSPTRIAASIASDILPFRMLLLSSFSVASMVYPLGGSEDNGHNPGDWRE
jgi:hypothetical protein